MDKGGTNRIPIAIPRMSIGTGIEEDMKKLARSRSSANFDGSQAKGSSIHRKKSKSARTYWAWLANMEPDALDGLTEEKKEQLRLAGADRRLVEQYEEEDKPEEEPVQRLMSRVTSEILISDRIETSLKERAVSEPSVLVPNASIMEKVKLWHPTGPVKALKPIIRRGSSRGFINVCFEKVENSPFAPRCKEQQKTQKKTKNEIPYMTPNISIVNMTFHF